MKKEADASTPPDRQTLPLTPDINDTEYGETEAQEALYYDPETDMYGARIESQPEHVPLEVISVVAAVSETHPMDLPPLYEDISPGAFDALEDLTITEASVGEREASMTYVGYEVTVHADGVICIRPHPDESPEKR